MHHLINKYLAHGEPAEFRFAYLEHPIEGRFVESNHESIAVMTKEGRIMVVNMRQLLSCSPIEAKQSFIHSRHAIFESIRPESPADASIDTDSTSQSNSDFFIRAENTSGNTVAKVYETSESIDFTMDNISENGNTGDQSRNNTNEFTSIAEALPENIWESEAPLSKPVLKVVGKIDLDRFPKKRFSLNEENYDEYEEENDKESWRRRLMPVMGHIKYISPNNNYGWIARDNAPDIHFFTYRMCIPEGDDKDIRLGSAVVFNVVRNPKGETAVAIHRPMSVDACLDFIEQRIQSHDMINAHNLKKQLLRAFPDDENIKDELAGMGLYDTTPRTNDRYARPAYRPQTVAVDPEAVLADIAEGKPVASTDMQKAEKALSDAEDPEYITKTATMLEFAKDNHDLKGYNAAVYQLYNRLIKFSDRDEALRLMDEARDYFSDVCENGSANYFSSKKIKFLEREAMETAAPESVDTDSHMPETAVASETDTETKDSEENSDNTPKQHGLFGFLSKIH